MTAPLTTDENFVNVYIVFDPSKGGSFICPEQILSFRTESGEVSTVAIGSAVMNNSQMDAIFKGVSSVSSSSNNQNNNTSSTLLPPSLPTPTTTTSDAPDTTISGASPPVPSTIGSCDMPIDLDNKTSPDPTPAIVTSTGDLPPLRALSAYNFFFRDERNRILNDDGEQQDEQQQQHGDCWSRAKQQQLLQEHWGRDRMQKRRHRKTHGKIDFTTLSRLISSRWKKLPASQKDFYRQVASMDFERYQNETSAKASFQKFHPIIG